MYKITYNRKTGILRINGIIYITIKITNEKEKIEFEKHIRDIQFKILKELTKENKNEDK